MDARKPAVGLFDSSEVEEHVQSVPKLGTTVCLPTTTGIQDQGSIVRQPGANRFVFFQERFNLYRHIARQRQDARLVELGGVNREGLLQGIVIGSG